MNSNEDIIFQSLEPQKLAYSLHEALRAVGVYPEFQDYTKLRDKYHIRLRAGKVIAELKGKQVVALVVEQLSKMVVKDITDALGIVGAATMHKAAEFYFPDAKLTHEDLISLYNWAEPVGYHIINSEEAGITLTKNHPGEMAWTPNTKNNGAPNP
jgi:hypothetical protein